MTDTATPTHVRPPYRHKPPPRPVPVPHVYYLRDFTLVGDGNGGQPGRKITIDKRAVAFVAQRKEDPVGTCIVAFKSGSLGVPIACPYEMVRQWWREDPAAALMAAAQAKANPHTNVRDRGVVVETRNGVRPR